MQATPALTVIKAGVDVSPSPNRRGGSGKRGIDFATHVADPRPETAHGIRTGDDL